MTLTSKMQGVVLAYMEGLDCPRSLTVAIMVRYEDWDQLTQLWADPSHYIDADSYFDAACATDLLRKYGDFNIEGLDLETEAVEKWLWAERQCFNTNAKLNRILDFGVLNGAPVDERVLDFLHDVKKYAHRIAGDGPNLENIGYFGPGATVSDDARRATVPHKMSSVPTLTTSAACYLLPWMGSKWAEACRARGDVPSFVEHDVFFTVPKTARSLRGCAKGPAINVFYQLGLGRDLRRRLRESGIDLTYGQDIHRQVACAGSKIPGGFCTIDLTSASDCVATTLVRWAMPHRWFQAMDDLRTKFTVVRQDNREKRFRLEKFSAMGNGFTFELETTIFLAICLAASRGQLTPGKDLFVYGDDILVPERFYEVTISALKFCGFTPNVRKSFSSGNFRESCGGDFFNGVAVRPYYLKEEIDENQPQTIIALANGIRSAAKENGSDPHRWRRVRRAWLKCLDLLSPDVRRCRGPQYFGDLVVHDDEERWSVRWRNHGNIRWIRVYRPSKYLGTHWSRFDGDIQFATALYGLRLHTRRKQLPDGSRKQTDYVLGRDAVLAYKVGWMPYS